MTIIQLVPTLDQSPASSAVIAINHCLVKQRIASFVVCNGGARVGEVTGVGGNYLPMDLVDQNPLSMVERARSLKALLERVNPDVTHVHGRVAAWIGCFANLKLGIPIVSTLHRTYTQNAFSEVMWRIGPLIPVSPEFAQCSLEMYRRLSAVAGLSSETPSVTSSGIAP